MAYLYLASAENGLYKIGMTRNIETRYAALRGSSPEKISVIFVMRSECANVIERELHDRFFHKRHHSEWFNLDNNDVELICGLGTNIGFEPPEIEREVCQFIDRSGTTFYTGRCPTCLNASRLKHESENLKLNCKWCGTELLFDYPAKEQENE